MRLLYVTDALAIYGGLERILVDKANRFSEESGYEVFLITVNQGKHPIVYPLNPQVKYMDIGIQFHQIYNCKGVRKLWKFIQLRWRYQRRIKEKIGEIAPDIIICLRIELTGAIVKVKKDIPIIYEAHTFWRGPRQLAAKYLPRLLLYGKIDETAMQKIVTLTEGDAAAWRKITPRVCAIPNIVNLNKTGRLSDCKAKSMIFVGRLAKQKDIGSLLGIWKLVHQTHPDWELRIFADYGNEDNIWRPIIEQMDAHISLYPPTPYIIDEYLKSSIFVLTSVFEPFGLVLPEAMSCGLPVVAFDCPYGPASIITDEVDGFLIPNRDIRLFAVKVCLLMEDKSLRLKMGKAGSVSSLRYDAGNIIPQWKQLFEQLIEEK